MQLPLDISIWIVNRILFIYFIFRERAVNRNFKLNMYNIQVLIFLPSSLSPTSSSQVLGPKSLKSSWVIVSTLLPILQQIISLLFSNMTLKQPLPTKLKACWSNYTLLTRLLQQLTNGFPLLSPLLFSLLTT